MRTIQAQTVADAVRDLFLTACACPPADVENALIRAAEQETEPPAREMLRQLCDNNKCARETGLPSCQDTGMAVLFADVGQDLHIEGDFRAAVEEGVARAYREGYLRKSVLTPLGRVNTGDNTPAILHTRLVPGDKLRLRAAPKGFGSENMSRIKMMKPSEGEEGLLEFLVESCRLAGGNPCPPVVLGVGIGGDFELAALMAKEQLLRPVGQPSADPDLARLEREALSRINSLGLGAMGLKGSIYCLGVHMASYPTHLAGLPVAVNFCCHALRHAEVTL